MYLHIALRIVQKRIVRSDRPNDFSVKMDLVVRGARLHGDGYALVFGLECVENREGGLQIFSLDLRQGKETILTWSIVGIAR